MSVEEMREHMKLSYTELDHWCIRVNIVWKWLSRVSGKSISPALYNWRI